MDRAKYETEICQRLEGADLIPFRPVSTHDWQPAVAKCHDNVDTWVRMNPNHRVVRGWVTNGNYIVFIGLTAHSIVRGPDGVMFDITPLYDETGRGEVVRQGMRFVEHLGSDEEFFAFEKEERSILCPVAADNALGL